MKTTQTTRKLRAGTALQALALVSAGVAGVAAFAAPAAAQDFTNVTASGRVQGTDGKPIVGATVAVTSNRQGFTRTATTDDNGSYRIPQLPMGTYSVTVSADGYDSFTDPRVDLTQSGAANTYTLAATGAAAAGGDIVVTAGRTQVADFEQTTTGAVINVSDIANRVPVARDITSVILLSPGTAQGDSAFGNLASIAGSSVGENAFYINGLNITNFRTFLGANSVPFEFYDTVDVKNGGYQAEFGRSTGGVITATTKSGSNDFHGGVVVTWLPDDLRSKGKNTYLQDNDGDYNEDLRSDFYLSGPIIKDHLFFYGLYESRNVGTGDGTTVDNGSQYTRTKTTSPFYAGKVDAVITDGQRLEFTYFRTTGESRYQYFNYNPSNDVVGAYKSDYIYQYGGENYVGRYTGTFSKWLTVSAAYGRSNDRTNTVSSDPDNPYILDYRSGTTGVNNSVGSLYPGANSVASQSTYLDKREFYRGDVDVYFKALGSHHVRFGYDRENLSTTGTSDYTGGAVYYIYSSRTYGDYIIRRTYENGGTFSSINDAFYVEDSWSLFNNRLNVQLGIRDDRFNNKNAAGQSFYKSGDQWGPRIGFTFDPTGTGRSKVYGSYGRYFLPVAANTNLRLAGSEYYVSDYFKFGGVGTDGQPILGDPLNIYSACIRTSNSNCRITGDGTVASTDTTVAKNLKPQSEDEFILGYEQRVGERWKLGTYFTYRHLNNVLEDAAIDQAAINYCNSHGLSCASLYTGFSQYVLLNPGSDATVTLLNGQTVTLTAAELGYPKAKRNFKAMTFTADRAFDGKWSLSASYTLSADVGNYEGGVESTIGQADTGLTEDFDQPGFTYGAYGYLPNHHRHNLKIYGSYQFADWLLVGANFQLLSPRKFGCNGVVPESVDPYASAYGVGIGNYCRFADGEVSNSNPIVLVQRGTAFQSDWLKQIDLSAAITLPTSAFNGVLRFDVFNVFNWQAMTEANEAGGVDDLTLSASDTYKLATKYQTPRYARVQLQMRF